MRGDRVQRLSNMIVSGDALDFKEGTSVVATTSLFHGPLITQERGALSEEDRESRKSQVGHSEPGVAPGARIRQLAGDGAEALNQIIEAVHFHGAY